MGGTKINAMGHREGSSRADPIRLNLEEHIEQANLARLIDAYVDSLDLKERGFSHVVAVETGRPPYHPGDLLKLYIYGYEHRLRSSRQLEVDKLVRQACTKNKLGRRIERSEYQEYVDANRKQAGATTGSARGLWNILMGR